MADGVLDEPEWASADAVDGFIQAEPFEGAAPTGRTIVRVLAGSKAIVIGIVCGVQNPQIKAVFFPLDGRTIDWAALERQPTEEPVPRFCLPDDDEPPALSTVELSMVASTLPPMVFSA